MFDLLTSGGTKGFLKELFQEAGSEWLTKGDLSNEEMLELRDQLGRSLAQRMFEIQRVNRQVERIIGLREAP